MTQETQMDRMFEALVSGDRPRARKIVQDTLGRAKDPVSLIPDLFWPCHEMIEKLYRSDQLTPMAYHLSTRLLRTLVDQAAARLIMSPRNGKTVFAACGPSQNEELAAQMAIDLLESVGYDATFAGGGAPADEILAQVHDRRPDYLLLFASAASDLPEIRRVIDTLREIGACPRTRVLVGGGVFNRAEGLADEIGADLFGTNPLELVDILSDPEPLLNTIAQERDQATETKRRRKAA